MRKYLFKSRLELRFFLSLLWLIVGLFFIPVLANEPSSVDDLLEKAAQYLNTDPEKADAIFEKLEKLKSTFNKKQEGIYYVRLSLLLGFHGEHKERVELLRSVIDTIDNNEVKALLFYQLSTSLTVLGKYEDVCAAFYGHPGVFACISHMAIADARAEGFSAHMEPGISAEDCLVADIGIDPGLNGMQTMETTQYMIYDRKIDPSSLLILWQPGLAGDLTLKRFDTNPAFLQVLVNKLARDYPLDHEVYLYEAATHPLEQTRKDKIRLRDLPAATLRQCTTLVIPAAVPLKRDEAIADELKALAALRDAAELVKSAKAAHLAA